MLRDQLLLPGPAPPPASFTTQRRIVRIDVFLVLVFFFILCYFNRGDTLSHPRCRPHRDRHHPVNYGRVAPQSLPSDLQLCGDRIAYVHNMAVMQYEWRTQQSTQVALPTSAMCVGLDENKAVVGGADNNVYVFDVVTHRKLLVRLLDVHACVLLIVSFALFPIRICMCNRQ